MQKRKTYLNWFSVLTALLLFVCGAEFSFAGELTFQGKTDKDPLTYQPGENIVFTVSMFEDGKPIVGEKEVFWIRRGDDGKKEEGTATISAEKPFEMNTSIETPGFVWLRVMPLEDHEKPYADEGRQFNGGAGVLLDQLDGIPEPEDFDAFWAKQKARLAEVPLKYEMKLVPPNECEDVLSYDIRVDCVGMPVSGYFCKPKNAAPKSLKARLSIPGYSTGPAYKPEWDGKENLALEINIHGIDNDGTREYYRDLSLSTYKDYGFSNEENADPEKSYWCSTALRLMRALEFLKAQPEWDGKNLIVTGASQGGFQSIMAASLDPDVSQCQPVVPWMSDVAGAVEEGRLPSLFRPEWVKGLGYYDIANHAKRVHCFTEIYAGLGDYICPPSGQMVLFNRLAGPATIMFVQGRTHGYVMENSENFFLEKKGK